MSVVPLKARAEEFEGIDGTGLEGFRTAVIKGLRRPQKVIPSRFFYDLKGSELFEQITEVEDYYPTRAELEIFETFGAEIAAAVPETTALVEFGSGSSRKIRALLGALTQLEVYAPIDISGEMLAAEAAALKEDYPDLEIVPVHADFMREVALPRRVMERDRLGFFPGSTVGNFLPREALKFLERVGRTLGPGGHLLIGVDRKKDEATLLRAYDDSQGVTAAFNLNLLSRLNNELGGDIELASFAHHVRYNRDNGRIEMHLKSLKKQTVHVAGEAFEFAEGETIHTEDSHKYAPEEFRLLARAAGFDPRRFWTDSANLFGVYLLKWAGS